jgi:hypothetical protein
MLLWKRFGSCIELAAFCCGFDDFDIRALELPLGTSFSGDCDAGICRS